MLQYRKDKIHPSLQTSDSLSSEHNGAPSFAHDWFILDNPISSRPSSTLGITKTQYLKGNEAEDVLHAEEWFRKGGEFQSGAGTLGKPDNSPVRA
jgi:hypothetical protein